MKVEISRRKIAALPRILTVAGSDSGGGAGIQADLKTIALLGGFGMSAVTALTAQNTRGVVDVFEVPAGFVGRQMEAVLSDIGADALKTGMLAGPEVVRVVCRKIRRYRLEKVVVDPVMVAKDGRRLLSAGGEEILRRELLPLALVATPNLPEGEALIQKRISSRKGMREAVVRIREMGPRNVLLKGGHLSGEPVDILFDGQVFSEWRNPRLPTPHTHGTGCTLSAAMATELAKGAAVREAVERARDLVFSALRFALPLGRGQGPVNILAPAAREIERYRTLTALSQALRALEEHKVGHLFPEVQANLGFALPDARKPEEVAAFPGRLVRLGGEVRAVCGPEFGASRHIAQIILTAMGHDPEMRAAMNLRLAPEILARAKKAGLRVGHFRREDEPRRIKRREGSSLSWGVEQVLRKTRGVPDLIYDRGDVGKEPMIRVLGHDPAEVVDKVLRLS